MTATDENLWHGYTLADLHKVVLWATTHDYVARSDDMEERRDAALFALAEELSTCAERPAKEHLVQVAKKASSQVVNHSMRHRGIDDRKETFGQPRVEFTRFWVHLPGDPLDERVVDAVALNQIWGQLSVGQRSALMALALCDDHAKAAETLGLRTPTYRERLRQARIRFLDLWHEGETPSRVWARDYRQGRTELGGRLLARRRMRAKNDQETAA